MYVLNIINFPLEGNQRKEERKKRKGRDDQCTIHRCMVMSQLSPIICTIIILAIN